jgi:acyl-CoA reductase-like NAD-dependent aldehyde dehydrogenase
MTRMLVPRARREEIVSAVADAVGKLVVGDPRDPSVDVGPLAFRAHYSRVLGILETAREQGAWTVPEEVTMEQVQEGAAGRSGWQTASARTAAWACTSPGGR